MQSLLKSRNCDFAWFPAVWPETYSYTLSTANIAGLYPVAFNFGTIAERIREADWGALLPMFLLNRPDEVARALCSLEIPKICPEQFTTLAHGYEDLLLEYYQLV